MKQADSEFLVSARETWRVFRIMSEFVEAIELMSKVGPAVSIYGGSRVKRSHESYKQARVLGRMLADANIGVITGGGPGIMEAANRGAAQNHGQSVGLNLSLIHISEPTRPY